MRRERRGKSKNYKFLYFTGLIAILLTIMIIIMYGVYNKKLNEISKSMLGADEIIGLSSNNGSEDMTNIIEITSSTIGKTIEEAQQEIENQMQQNIIENEIVEENTTQTSVEENTKPVVEVKKELKFAYPVEGEILREYSMDELIFSETLDEWTVHQGLDIKAERTTVVKAAEEGTIVAIKNDPRYGLTVIIEHEDGYKTIYSNLLSTEFVSEDEKVEKGQSIGTVGNSAVFEIADEPHLHFEMLKDGEYLDPKLLLK